MRNFVGIYINEHKPQEMEKTFPVNIEKCYIAENWDARDHHWRIYRGIGIFLESVWLGTIFNNTIEYNGRPYTEARGWYDMYWAQGFGILFRSSKADILSNIIRYNWRGIFFWESSMGRIAYNQIVWNTVRPHEPPWWWWWSFPWWYYWTWHWKFHGIGIWLETSSNPIIEYNEISHNGAKYTAQFMHNYWETCDESYGIRAHAGSNPIIRYNNITWNGYFGVRSYDSSSPEVYNNNVSWNGFKAYDHSWGIGVFVGYAATWKIYNNTIMFNGNHHAGGAWGWGWGIISDWHSTAMIVNNTIQRNWCGMRLHGCRLGSIIERNNISYNGFTYWWYPRGVGISIYVPISWGGQFPVIKNNYIGYNGFYGGHGPSVDYWWQAGIHSYVGGSNAKIGAGNVLDSNEYAFAIWSTSLTITDTVIKNSFSSDFFITDSTSITLINNTHEKGRIIFGDDSSTIKAFWYVDFKVIWKETKAPVQSAGLDLYDNSERYTFSAYTDMEGKTKRYIVQEYENSRVRWLSYTPYRIEVFIKGKSIANETVSINRTMSVLLEIEESSPPKISIVEPEENASFSSHIVQLIGTADDDESGVHVVDIAVGAGNWIRIPGYGLTTWNYTLELPADGDYTVFAKATDRAGNYDVDWVKFTVKEAEPFFHVTFPPNDYITSTPTVRVTGIADRGLTISVNGEEVSVYERAFSKYVDLIEGNNIIKVEAKDIVGNVRTESRVVILDTIKPFIQINFPPDNYETNENIVKVDGITEEGADITVNGEGVPTIRGSFVKDVVLKTGPNAIYIEAIDKAGNQNSTILDVKYDNVPPDLSVFTPHQNALLNRTDVKVTGVTEEDAILTINDKKVDIRAGRFDSLLTLIEGNNTIVITASDTAGNKNTIIRNVFVDTVPPMLVVIEPRQGEITNKLTIQVSGTTEVGARVYIGGSEIPVFNGTFCTNVTLLDNILNNITVTAEDIVKNSRTVTREVRVDTQPPGLTVTEPEDGFKVRKGTLIIVGVTEPDIVELEVNGKPLTWDTMTGQFSGSLELVTGKNVITVTAKDSAGNVATVTKEGEYTIEKAGISFGIYSWLWLIFGFIIGTCVTFPVIIALTRRHLRKKFEEYGIEPYEIEEPEEIEEPGEIEEPEKIEEEDLGPEEIEEELPPEEEER
ncbi:MAG: right-handed parallel beta-helix repeat-containing protein, partial [Candidatus Thermoplasmatota archaeon]